MEHTFQGATSKQLMESILSLVSPDIRGAARVDFQTAIHLAILDDKDGSPFYTKDQQRAADYIVSIANIGGGEDPVGFLIASHSALREKLVRMKLPEMTEERISHILLERFPEGPLDECYRKARKAILACLYEIQAKWVQQG